MQYKSPFGILTNFISGNESLINLDFALLKKRIFAEFELSGKTTIGNKGNEFSKNDFIQWFENIKKYKDFEHHILISDLPDLQLLLENNEIKKQLSFNNSHYQNNGFISFISPYLAESLGLFLSNQIKERKRPVKLEYQTKFPLLKEHEPILIEPVSLAIGEIITDINDMCSYFLPTESFPDTRVYFSDNIVATIGSLPGIYFSKETELYTRCGIELIHFLSKPTKNGIPQLSTAKYIQKQLLKIELNPEIRNKIKLQNIPNEDFAIKTKSKNDPGKGCLKTFLLIIGIIVISLFRWICKSSDNEQQSIPKAVNVRSNPIILVPDTLGITDSIQNLPEITIKPKRKD